MIVRRRTARLTLALLIGGWVALAAHQARSIPVVKGSQALLAALRATEACADALTPQNPHSKDSSP